MLFYHVEPQPEKSLQNQMTDLEKRVAILADEEYDLLKLVTAETDYDPTDANEDLADARENLEQAREMIKECILVMNELNAKIKEAEAGVLEA